MSLYNSMWPVCVVPLLLVFSQGKLYLPSFNTSDIHSLTTNVSKASYRQTVCLDTCKQSYLNSGEWTWKLQLIVARSCVTSLRVSCYFINSPHVVTSAAMYVFLYSATASDVRALRCNYPSTEVTFDWHIRDVALRDDSCTSMYLDLISYHTSFVSFAISII